MTRWVRHWKIRNSAWDIRADEDGKYDDSQVLRAIVLDIRSYLERMTAILECRNTRDIPDILRGIQDNTRKKKRKAKR